MDIACEYNTETIHRAALFGAEYACELEKKFDANNFCATWMRLYDSGMGKIFVCEAGTIGCAFTNDMMTGEPQCFISFWFVSPRFRGKGYGKMLLDRAEQNARAIGCKAMIHGHPGLPSEGIKKLGFEVIETGYKKKL